MSLHQKGAMPRGCLHVNPVESAKSQRVGLGYQNQVDITIVTGPLINRVSGTLPLPTRVFALRSRPDRGSFLG